MTRKNPVLFVVMMAGLLVLTSSCKEGSFLERRADNFKAHYNKYYNANDNFKRGVKSFEEAKIDVDPELYLNIFRVPNSSSAREFDKVITKCAEILRKHPRSKWVDNSLLLIGKAYFFKNNYVGAEQKFNEVINSESPLGDEASFWLGRTLVAAEATEAAISHLEASLAGEMDKKWRPQLNLLLADLYAQNGDWENSLEQIEAGLEGVRDDETGGRAQFLKGQIMETVGQYEEAAAAYHSVRKYKPLYELAYAAQYNRARVYGLFLDAEEGLDLVVKMTRDDKNFDNLENLDYLEGLIHQKQGNGDTALDIYLDMLYPDPSVNRPVAGTLKGRVHYSLGELHRDLTKDFVLSSMYFDTSATVLKMPAEADQQYTSHALHNFNENADTFRRFRDVANSIEEMDSLLYLGTLSEDDFASELVRIQEERQLEARRKRDEIEKKRAEAGFGGSGGAAVSRRPTSGAAGGNFGFLDHRSEDRIRQGFLSFRALWGERPLVNNWRREEAVAQEIADVVSTDELDSVTEALELGLAPLDPTAVPRDSIALGKMLTDRANARYELGNVLFLALNMPDSAITWYQKVIDEDTEEDVALRALYATAEAKSALGKSDEANRIYDQIVNEFPESEFENRAREKLGMTVNEVVRDSMLLAQASYAQAYDVWQAGDLEGAGESMLLTAYEYHTTDVAAQALLASGLIYTEWAQTELDDFEFGDPIPLREDLFDSAAHDEAIAIKEAEDERIAELERKAELRRLAAEEKAAKEADAKANLQVQNNISNLTSEITRKERELRMKRNTLNGITEEDPSYQDLTTEVGQLAIDLSQKRKDLENAQNGVGDPVGQGTENAEDKGVAGGTTEPAIGDEDMEIEENVAEALVDSLGTNENEIEEKEEVKPDYFIREIIPLPYRLIHVYESVEKNFETTDYANGAKYRRAAIQEVIDEKQAAIDSVRNAEQAALRAEEEAKRLAENPPDSTQTEIPADSLALEMPEVIAANEAGGKMDEIANAPSTDLEQPEDMQQLQRDPRTTQVTPNRSSAPEDPNARRDGESRSDYEKRMIAQMKAGAVGTREEAVEMEFIYLLKKYGSRTSSKKAYLKFVQEFPDLQVISQVIKGTRVFYLTSPAYESEEKSSFFDLELLPFELRDEAYLEALEIGAYQSYDFKPAERVAKVVEVDEAELTGRDRNVRISEEGSAPSPANSGQFGEEPEMGEEPKPKNSTLPEEGEGPQAESDKVEPLPEPSLEPLPEQSAESSSEPAPETSADLPSEEPKAVQEELEKEQEDNPKSQTEVKAETGEAEKMKHPVVGELLSPAIKDGWAVICASKASLKEAIVVRDQLVEKGVQAQIIPSISGGKTIYRVAAFVSENKSEANSYLSTNKGKSIPSDSWVTAFTLKDDVFRPSTEKVTDEMPEEKVPESRPESENANNGASSESKNDAAELEISEGLEKGWAIIVASKSEITEAFQVVTDLKKRGFAAELIPVEVNGKSIYRVASALFKTQKEASDALNLGRGKTLPADAWVSTFDKTEYLDQQ